MEKRMTDENKDKLKDDVIAAIRECYDPEIPVNIYDLGLIYDVLLDDNKNVNVNMTLTSPACPVAGTLPGDVQLRIGEVEGVQDVKVEVVWDPPWNPDMMSEAAKLELNMM
jgi:FeS assembly SUF system protein